MEQKTRRRYKIVLNIDIDDPEQEYPGGGDFMHLNRIQGTIYSILGYHQQPFARITLDKVVDKGECGGSQNARLPRF